MKKETTEELVLEAEADREEMRICMQRIKEHREHKKENPTTPYQEVIKYKHKVENNIEFLRDMALPRKTAKGIKPNVEPLFLKDMNDIAGKYTPDNFLTDKEKFSSNIAKLNASIDGYKFRVISSDRHEFGVTYL